MNTDTKLTETQISIMFLLCEGEIYYDDSEVFSIEDADNNTYSIRRSTFYCLLRKGMIELKRQPSLNMDIYGLTKKGEKYMLDNLKEEIKNFA